MPIYEFHCDKCEQDSEILVRSSEWKGTRCPHCGSTKLAKKLSVFASSVAGGSGDCAGGACEMPAAPACGMAGGCGCGRRGSHRH